MRPAVPSRAARAPLSGCGSAPPEEMTTALGSRLTAFHQSGVLTSLAVTL